MRGWHHWTGNSTLWVVIVFLLVMWGIRIGRYRDNDFLPRVVGPLMARVVLSR